MSLVITAYLAFRILVSMIDSLDYAIVDRIKSPDSKFELVQFSSRSEGGHSPYGHYLVVSNRPGFQKIQDGHIIFAGYCAKEIVYKWMGNDKISISCQGADSKDIKTLSIKAYGKDIEYVGHPKNS